MWKDLLVNGTSLSTYGGIVDFSGINASAPLRGSSIIIPGVTGAHFTAKVRDAYVFPVPMVLLGTSQANYEDRLDGLRTLLNSATTALALTRRRTTGAGNISETASGEYLEGLDPTAVNLQTGRIVINIVNLSGGWT